MDTSSHRVESRSQGAESGSQRVEWLVSTLLGLARGEVELSIDSDEYAMAAQEVEKLNVALNDSDDDSLMSLLIDLNMPAAVEAAIEHVAAHHDECDDADSSLAYECAQMVMAIVRRRKDAGTMLRSIPTLFSVVLDVQMMPDVRQTAADVLVALTSETDRTDGKSISCLKLWKKFNNLVTCERYLVGACSFALQEAMLWLMCSWPQCDAIVKALESKYASLPLRRGQEELKLPDVRGLLSRLNEQVSSSSVLSLWTHEVQGLGARATNAWVDWNAIDVVCRQLMLPSVRRHFDAKLNAQEFACVSIERALRNTDCLASSEDERFWLRIQLTPSYAETMPLPPGAHDTGELSVSFLLDNRELVLWKERVAPRLLENGIAIHEVLTQREPSVGPVVEEVSPLELPRRMMSCTKAIHVRSAAMPQPSSLLVSTSIGVDVDATPMQAARKTSSTEMMHVGQQYPPLSGRALSAAQSAASGIDRLSFNMASRRASVTNAIRSCRSGRDLEPQAMPQNETPSNEAGVGAMSSCEEVSEPEGHSKTDVYLGALDASIVSRVEAANKAAPARSDSACARAAGVVTAVNAPEGEARVAEAHHPGGGVQASLHGDTATDVTNPQLPGICDGVEQPSDAAGQLSAKQYRLRLRPQASPRLAARTDDRCSGVATDAPYAAPPLVEDEVQTRPEQGEDHEMVGRQHGLAQQSAPAHDGASRDDAKLGSASGRDGAHGRPPGAPRPPSDQSKAHDEGLDAVARPANRRSSRKAVSFDVAQEPAARSQRELRSRKSPRCMPQPVVVRGGTNDSSASNPAASQERECKSRLENAETPAGSAAARIATRTEVALAKQPPAKQPPASQSPAKQPPSSRSPAKQPPAKQPPTMLPPGKQPPATQPPASKSPAKQLPASRPPAEQPPAKQAPASKSPAKQPPAKSRRSPANAAGTDEMPSSATRSEVSALADVFEFKDGADACKSPSGRASLNRRAAAPVGKSPARASPVRRTADARDTIAAHHSPDADTTSPSEPPRRDVAVPQAEDMAAVTPMADVTTLKTTEDDAQSQSEDADAEQASACAEPRMIEELTRIIATETQGAMCSFEPEAAKQVIETAKETSGAAGASRQAAAPVAVSRGDVRRAAPAASASLIAVPPAGGKPTGKSQPPARVSNKQSKMAAASLEPRLRSAGKRKAAAASAVREEAPSTSGFAPARSPRSPASRRKQIERIRADAKAVDEFELEVIPQAVEDSHQEGARRSGRAAATVGAELGAAAAAVGGIGRAKAVLPPAPPSPLRSRGASGRADLPDVQHGVAVRMSESDEDLDDNSLNVTPSEDEASPLRKRLRFDDVADVSTFSPDPQASASLRSERTAASGGGILGHPPPSCAPSSMPSVRRLSSVRASRQQQHDGAPIRAARGAHATGAICIPPDSTTPGAVSDACAGDERHASAASEAVLLVRRSSRMVRGRLIAGAAPATSSSQSQARQPQPPASKRRVVTEAAHDSVDAKRLRSELLRFAAHCHECSTAAAGNVVTDASRRLNLHKAETRALLDAAAKVSSAATSSYASSSSSPDQGAAAEVCKKVYDALRKRAASLNRMAEQRVQARYALRTSAAALLMDLTASRAKIERQSMKAYETARQTVEHARVKKESKMAHVQEQERKKNSGENSLLALMHSALHGTDGD